MRRLKVMIYDDTDLRKAPEDIKPDQFGLTASWLLGGLFYRWFAWLTKTKGVSSWDEAFEYLLNLKLKSGQLIWEIQFWGHGQAGRAFIDGDPFQEKDLEPGGRYHEKMLELSARLDPKGHIWFRTCSTAHGVKGKMFMELLAKMAGCTVAAHTFIIGVWQSGLHTVEPGEAASWPVKEGVAQGEALWSHKRAPNTISFLHGFIPRGW